MSGTFGLDECVKAKFPDSLGVSLGNFYQIEGPDAGKDSWALVRQRLGLDRVVCRAQISMRSVSVYFIRSMSAPQGKSGHSSINEQTDRGQSGVHVRKFVLI